jgi:hypothetical protein
VAVNPFVWDRPLDDPARIVGRDAFADELARTLKGQTNVALFGPRGTGKSTLIAKLAERLGDDHGPDAPRYATVVVNLDRAISVPAFVAAVRDAVVAHPDGRIRRRAREELARVEAELGVNLGVVSATLRRGPDPAAGYAEVLHAQLRGVARLADRLVVVFDEFQRLRRCPGDPLLILRSALMGRGAGHVSLVFAGSIREALRLMLEQSDQPIFQQAARVELPPIAVPAFFDYLELSFRATGRPPREDALEHLLRLTRAHPKRTQQLAWWVWNGLAEGEDVTIEAVESAFESIVSSAQGDVGELERMLTASGESSDENMLRALFLVADQEGGDVALTNRSLLALYGLTQHSTLLRALERLRERALVREAGRGRYELIDPFHAAWLRARSPVGARRVR